MSVSLKWSKFGKEPVATIEVVMVNDIYRLARHLQRGQSEFAAVGTDMLNRLRAEGGEEWFTGVCAFFGDPAPRAPVPDEELV